MNPTELVGRHFPFYGVSFNCFKIGDLVLEAVEDPSDGYRSFMKSDLMVSPENAGPFFCSPIATVLVREVNDGYFDGFELMDVSDGHSWLRFGTNNYDDYYPYFVFNYAPKEPKVNQ